MATGHDNKILSALYCYYCEFDAEKIIDGFHAKDQTSEPEVIKNFLGTKIAPYVFPTLLQHRIGEVEGKPAPGNWHADIAEWAAALHSVSQAKYIYRIVELGCGWGCWITNMGIAARGNGLNLDLIGIEGDQYHLKSAQKTLELNGFTENDYKLHHGVAAPKKGKAAFPAHKEDGVNWGAEPVFYPSDSELEAYKSDPSFTVLECMPLGDLSNDQEIDLLHIDIQGAEFDYVQGNYPAIEKYVKRILIGTHSRVIEGQLAGYFLENNWRLEMERPVIIQLENGRPRTVIDGVQMWANPKLI